MHQCFGNAYYLHLQGSLMQSVHKYHNAIIYKSTYYFSRFDDSRCSNKRRLLDSCNCSLLCLSRRFGEKLYILLRAIKLVTDLIHSP